MEENKIIFLGSSYGEHSRWGLFDSKGISPTLTAAMGMGGSYVPMILEDEKMDKINIIGKMDNTIDHTFESANRVYDSNGICPTIPTCAGGGIQPKILEENGLKTINIPQTVLVRKYNIDIAQLKTILREKKKNCGLSCKEIAEQLDIPITQVEHYFRTDDSFAIPEPNIWKSLANLINIHDSELDKKIMTFEEKEGVFEKSERHYLDSGISPTIMTSNNDKIICKEYDKKVSTVAIRGRYLDEDEKKTKQQLEINEEEVCNCLTSVQKDSLIMEKEIKKIGQISSEGSQCGTAIDDSGCSSTISAGTHGYGNAHIHTKYRIRKLTVKECFRLMNFDDEDFYRAESVTSNSQLYKMAGNSIVVSCLAAIFSQLNIKGVKPWNEMSLEEKDKLSQINRKSNPGYEKNII